MGITDFSTVEQWAPFARRALEKHQRSSSGGGGGIGGVLHSIFTLPLSLVLGPGWSREGAEAGGMRRQ